MPSPGVHRFTNSTEQEINMAEKKSGANGTTTPMVVPPAGMARVGSVANAPWWDIKEGNVLYGVLENVYERPDERAVKSGGKSKFYQVRLLEDTEVMIGRGKERIPGKAKRGDVVNLNYGPKTKEFEKFIPDIMRGGEYTVWCHVSGPKFDIGKGQSMWPIDARAQQTKAPLDDSEPDFEGDDAEAGAQA